jgi:hypothetical protein
MMPEDIFALSKPFNPSDKTTSGLPHQRHSPVCHSKIDDRHLSDGTSWHAVVLFCGNFKKRRSALMTISKPYIGVELSEPI